MHDLWQSSHMPSVCILNPMTSVYECLVMPLHWPWEWEALLPVCRQRPQLHLLTIQPADSSTCWLFNLLTHQPADFSTCCLLNTQLCRKQAEFVQVVITPAARHLDCCLCLLVLLFIDLFKLFIDLFYFPDSICRIEQLGPAQLMKISCVTIWGALCAKFGGNVTYNMRSCFQWNEPICYCSIHRPQSNHIWMKSN